MIAARPGGAWRFALACALALAAPGAGAWAAGAAAGPSQVRVLSTDSGYQLQVDGKPFYIKGAGMENGNMDALVAAGGNSFRTWRADKGRELLDGARQRGLVVALGLEMGVERNGFDYGDAHAVARQFAKVQSQVRRFKDHPALLLWVVGNELNLQAKDPRVWNAVNDIALMIHREDPNHPVMTTLAGFDGGLAAELKARAPALDLIGIQLYGDIVELPQKLAQGQWTGPYVVTEWGPTGHWEIAKTAWGAAIEDDSTHKAAAMFDRYQRYIAADKRQCLGSYVFLWGNKQERTPTWYGLFLEDGEATAGVDAMQYLWTRTWPANRAPAIAPISLDGKKAAESVHLHAGATYEAHAASRDPDGDAVSYRWVAREESRATTIGGDPEELPPKVQIEGTPLADGGIRFAAPSKPGAYRLFVVVRDAHGHAAHANIPFMVD